MDTSFIDFTIALGLISESQSGHALRLSELSHLPPGKCLVILQVISAEEHRLYLEAFSLFRDGVATKRALKSALDVSARQGWSLRDALIMLDVDISSVRRSRLGELLLDANVVEANALDFGLNQCHETSLPLGWILTALSLVSESTIDYALFEQSRTRRGEIERSDAVENIAWANAGEKKSSIRQGQHYRLGQLLEKANLLTAAQVQDAVSAAERECQFSGFVMVRDGLLTEKSLSAALCAQHLVDLSFISMGSAIEILHTACDVRKEYKEDRSKISFYNFIQAAGMLDTETEEKLLDVLMQQTGDARVALSSNYRAQLESTELLELLRRLVPHRNIELNVLAVLYDLVFRGKLSLVQGLLAFCKHKSGIKSAPTVNQAASA